MQALCEARPEAGGGCHRMTVAAMSISDLVRLMSDGDFHSGQVLGERLGVSRTAVWKQLRKVEDMGLDVECIRGRGYRLLDPPEPLDGASIVARLGRDARQHLRHLFVEDALDSTNTFLLERFAQGAGHGEVCITERQLQGRGRRGRSWHSEWGGSIHFSIGWQFESGVAALEGLSLATGVIMAELLESYAIGVRLKWPNDLIAPGSDGMGKLGGVLVEVRGDVSGPCQAVIGVGVNVRLSKTSRSTIGQPVATLHDSRPEMSRNILVAQMVEAHLRMLTAFERDGFAAWQPEWERYHLHAGERVRIIQGDCVYEGMAEGVDGVGNLIVDVDGRRLRFSGGEVSLRGHT